MHRLVKRSFIVLTCLMCLALQLCCTYAHAAQQMTTEQWKQLTNDKDFDYVDQIEKVKEQQEYKPSTFEKGFSAFIRFWKSDAGIVIMWILVGLLASWLIYKIFIQKDSFLFGRNNKVMAEDTSAGDDEKDLASTDWETLLQRAADNKDFRLAIRYSYMWMLQLLQQRSLIQYRIDKTNYEYYTELAETNFKQPFRQLSRQYEYVWYGRFDLSHATYAEYKQLFDNVKRQMGA